MTQDEIIEMAMSAGIIPWTKHEHVGGNNFSASDEGLDGDLASLIQFAKLVAAKEREACAKVCDEIEWRFKELLDKFLYELDAGGVNAAQQCSQKIRARGQA